MNPADTTTVVPGDWVQRESVVGSRAASGDGNSGSSRTESEGRVTNEQVLRFAHDFNNVLTLILGYGETLQMILPEDKRLQPIAEEICRAAREGAQLTQRLSGLAQEKTSDSH